MKKTFFYVLGTLFVMITASCNAKSPKVDKDANKPDSIEEVEKISIRVLQPNDRGVVYSGKLLNHCVEGLTKLRSEAITDSTTLYAEVHKAIELERAFLKCFNMLHADCNLSNAQKADSMANEAYAEIDSLGETGVTSNMVEYIDKHFYLDRYRELLCYKDIVSSNSSMTDSQKEALLDEIIAWHKFFDAVTEFALQGVKLDFFTGGSLVAIVAPDCVWSAQKCRVNSLKALLYNGIKKRKDIPKDYKKQFLNKLRSRVTSLSYPSFLDYTDDEVEKKRYRNEWYAAKTEMLPRVVSTLKEWEQKRKILISSIYQYDNNLLYDNDVSFVLGELSEIIVVSY